MTALGTIHFYRSIRGYTLGWLLAGLAAILASGCIGNPPPDGKSDLVEKSAMIGETVTIDGGQEGAASYQWVQTAGPVVPLDTPHNAQLLFTPAQDGEYAFTLTVTNTDGSTRTIVVQVSVKSSPAALKADAGADRVVLPGHSVGLAGTATGGTPPYQYVWTPADGLDDPLVAQVTATPLDSTVYTLTVTDSAGASATDSARVAVGMAVSGPYWTNTTWTVEESPYVLVGDVQIPEGIVLTIQPGVEVVYTGATKLYVKGTVVANGTSEQMITFAGVDAATTSPATFIKFEGANLSDSQLSYLHMSKSVLAIRVGEESEFDQKPKNTGVLTVTGAALEETEVRTDGYDTAARLVLSGCMLTSCTVHGEPYLSEPIDLVNCTIASSQINSAWRNKGINLTGCTVSDTFVLIGGNGANMRVQESVLADSAFEAQGTSWTESLSLGGCQCTNVGMYMPGLRVDVADCTFNYDTSFAPTYVHYGSELPAPTAKLTIGRGQWEYSTIIGNAAGTGLAVADYEGSGALTMAHCTLAQNETAILVKDGTEACAITDCNLGGNTSYAVDNRRGMDVDGANSYWGTTDPAEIATRIRDYYDDITLGKVTFEPFATAAIPDAGPRP
jgi:hypothetical protein